MNCFKIKNTCGDTIYSTCVKYEGSISPDSDLYQEDCVDIQQVAEDLYTITDDIKELLEVESLRGGCIDYPQQNFTIHTVLVKYQELLCEMQTTISQQAITIASLEQRIDDLEQNICN